MDRVFGRLLRGEIPGDLYENVPEYDFYKYQNVFDFVYYFFKFFIIAKLPKEKVDRQGDKANADALDGCFFSSNLSD